MTTSVVIAHGGAPFEAISRFVAESQDDFRIVRTLPSARGALDAARRTRPELLLLGIEAPFTRTFDILRAVHEELPSKVVVICARGDAGWAVEALRAGAAAYLFADAEKADVVRILRMISAPPEPPRPSAPTGRLREVPGPVRARSPRGGESGAFRPFPSRNGKASGAGNPLRVARPSKV